eukprot:gene2508-16657_t
MMTPAKTHATRAGASHPRTPLKQRGGAPPAVTVICGHS